MLLESLAPTHAVEEENACGAREQCSLLALFCYFGPFDVFDVANVGLVYGLEWLVLLREEVAPSNCHSDGHVLQHVALL